MRIFFGIALEPKDREAVKAVANRSMEQNPAGKWVPSENYHLTLKYIGELGESDVRRMVSLLDPIQESVKAFDWICDRIDTFTTHKGTVLWLGTSEAQREFTALRDALLHRLDPGHSADPFVPHITLGRKTSKRCETLDPPLLMHLDNVTLFESVRIDGKLVYRPIASRKLKPPSPR